MMNAVGLNNVANTSFERRTQGHSRVETSNLSYREVEIFNQIQSRVSSALGVPVKVFDGEPQVTSRGIRLFLTGFTSSDISSPFVICQRMLARLSENEDEYREFMSNLSRMISAQIQNQSNQQEAENATAQKATERTSHQIRVSMMSVLDFWNENQNEGRSWTQAIQGQAIQQMVGRYEQMLSGQ